MLVDEPAELRTPGAGQSTSRRDPARLSTRRRGTLSFKVTGDKRRSLNLIIIYSYRGLALPWCGTSDCVLCSDRVQVYVLMMSCVESCLEGNLSRDCLLITNATEVGIANKDLFRGTFKFEWILIQKVCRGSNFRV